MTKQSGSVKAAGDVTRARNKARRTILAYAASMGGEGVTVDVLLSELALRLAAQVSNPLSAQALRKASRLVVL